MKVKTILRNLVPASLALAGMMSTTSTALAQAASPEGHFRTPHGELVLVVGDNCKSLPCELSFQGARVRIFGGLLLKNSKGIYTGHITRTNDFGERQRIPSEDIRILSNLPINQIQVETDNGDGNIPIHRSGKQLILRQTSFDSGFANYWINLQDYKDRQDLVLTASAHPNVNIGVLAVSIRAGSALNLSQDMRASALPLIAAYQGVLEHMGNFRQIVARDSADARHLARLQTHLQNLLKLMVDEKGEPLLPVTHRRVTEGSRMIMVLSTVLEEITDKYDFTSNLLEPLKPAKEVLSQLSREIRISYGWEEGLAGSGSKALAALSSILDSELRSLYSLVATYNSDPQIALIFNNIFRVNSNLFNRVSASNAGDAAGLPLARDLLIEWNKPEFQRILTGMMSAPQEAQTSLQNRLLMALTAIESIKDYVDPRGENKFEVTVPAQVKSRLP